MTSKQLYWICCHRRVAAARQMNANWLMMNKMCQQSHMTELDVKLLFRKARRP